MYNKKLFLTELLTETLHYDHYDTTEIEEMGLSTHCSYAIMHLRLGHELINKINDLKPDNASVWKSNFHKQLALAINQTNHLQFIDILMFEPFTRTIIIEVPKQMDTPQYKRSMTLVKDTLLSSSRDAYPKEWFYFATLPIRSLDQLSTGYKQVRNMDSCRYSIGTNRIMFLDDYVPWVQNMDLYNFVKTLDYYLKSYQYKFYKQKLIDLYSYFKSNIIENETLCYMYKEIIMLLIQHFNKAPLLDEELLGYLNTHLWSFEKHFQDLNQIHQWLINQVDTQLLEEQTAVQAYHPAVNQLIGHLYVHYKENLTLRELASILSLSESYLSRLIKKELGRNFIDLLIDIRMEKAKQLLGKTELTIKNIACQIGYESAISFIRQFKKREDCTPSRYRIILSAQSPNNK